MHDEHDPPATPDLDSPALDTSDLDTPDEHLTPAWRRPLLLLSGVSLLGLGVFLNAEALGLELGLEQQRRGVADAPAYVEQAPDDEDMPIGTPVFVRFLTDGAVEDGSDEAGGTGQRHKGEEGMMGRAHTKPKSGLYALKGPNNAVPQMARNFDPASGAGNAGVLGVQTQQGGHFLASPYGGAFAVGNDDTDVWGGLTGTEVGEAYGAGGLGLVGTGRGGGGVGEGIIGLGGGVGAHQQFGDRYQHTEPARFILTKDDLKSTFSIDVDTAAYANTRRHLLEFGELPPIDAVRSEELINYFDYDYPQPSGGVPFSVTTEVGPCPWNPEHRLVHVGVQGDRPALQDTPARNLVFLIDVSGSMSSEDKLPLVKRGLASLTQQLRGDDRVSIVVYAGAAGAVLEPTEGDHKQEILAALDRLESGGGTNGGEGIELAYQLAERHFVKGGINRVILASDGDFNVGISDHDALLELIENKRESGVFLSVLGFGTGNFNDRTMEQLADKGNGNYAYIDGLMEARKVLVEQAGATLHTIAKDVKIQVEFDAEQVERYRLIGYENRVLAHRDFDDDRKDAGEIGAGHTVTAIYEIDPSAQAGDDDPLMQLHMRYKQPDGARSQKISVPVLDRGEGMGDSSSDYRFAAAVAAFGDRLRQVEDGAGMSYAQILELAAGSLGEDASCYRHQFLDLVWKAGTLSGETIVAPDSRCTPGQATPPTVAKPLEVVDDVDDDPSDALDVADDSVLAKGDPSATSEEPFDWAAFTLEVLRLLPPLLALPMFVMALGRPRRRRRG